VACLLIGLVAGVAGWRLTRPTSATPQALLPSVVPPAPTSSSPSGPRTVTVLGAGDVLIHPEVWQQAAADARAAGKTGFDFSPMFAGVQPAITAADLALCHLETPVAEPGGPFSGFPYFNAPPQVATAIKEAGFDGCSTASNHAIDQGAAGVSRTLSALDAAGLGHTGSFRSPQEAATPKLYDVRGIKIAHLSYSLHFNGLRRPAGQEWLANLIEPDKIAAAAHRARAAGAEIVVVSLHWGTEYRHVPDANQLTWARQVMASPDVDLVLGHHAHVVQPFERYGDKWVVFGMGNELARHAEPINDNREGVMARMTFTEVAPHRWWITRAEAIPTWVTLAPRIRLVDLPVALADPATPPALKATYQGAYDRIKRYLTARGAASAGLVLAG
jgi:hypothetical protein